jgi:hypothetical protein
MAEAKIVQEWLEIADEDLDFAASVIEDSPYRAQQVIASG